MHPLGVGLLPSVWCIWASYQSWGKKAKDCFKQKYLGLMQHWCWTIVLFLWQELHFYLENGMLRWGLIWLLAKKALQLHLVCELIKYSLSHGENLSFSNWFYCDLDILYFLGFGEDSCNLWKYKMCFYVWLYR